jgi:hypothetical protein
MFGNESGGPKVSVEDTELEEKSIDHGINDT